MGLFQDLLNGQVRRRAGRQVLADAKSQWVLVPVFSLSAPEPEPEPEAEPELEPELEPEPEPSARVVMVGRARVVLLCRQPLVVERTSAAIVTAVHVSQGIFRARRVAVWAA
eukprot:TRINITY_DN985_c0_g1_i19.p1 TRINITY_DN985_c0_g1~~TRINITY_DN985_c0_g1_i19.p1  ORF type:complete len:112 (-),score=12.49 TRINITY_DN985_c0_g1_i19:682-1017(-)